MRRMILYLLGIGLMVYLAALYESSLLVAVLALQILAPIPSCILGWRAAKGLNARLSVPIPAADKGEEILVELQLQNSDHISEQETFRNLFIASAALSAAALIGCLCFLRRWQHAASWDR